MLPPEIFSEIFSCLASEARALIACSRAHRTFPKLIEPILYAHVIVHNHDTADEDEHHLKLKPHQFSALLSDNPRIVNYVRSLCLDLFRFHAGVLKEIITILGELKLERIQLTLSHGVKDWPSLPSSFRTAFVACISTSFMKEILLDAIGNMRLSSFADCAGLKRLRLFYYAVPSSNISCKFPHLEALELFDWNMDCDFHHFFSWLPTHACGLRTLTLTTTLNSVIRTFLPRLLAICSTSLVNLSIYYTSKPIYPVARVVLTLSYHSKL